MQVKEIMTRGVELVNFDTTVVEAAIKMKALDIGILPVVQDNAVTGILTDRDIVLRGVAERRDLMKTRVSDIMTLGVISCAEDDALEDAARLMEEKQIQRLLVLDHDSRAVGIISLRDVATRCRDEHLIYEVVESIKEQR